MNFQYVPARISLISREGRLSVCQYWGKLNKAKSNFQRSKRRYCFTQQSHWAISCCKRLEGKKITSIGSSVWTNALKNLPKTLKRGKHTEVDPLTNSFKCSWKRPCLRHLLSEIRYWAQPV